MGGFLCYPQMDLFGVVGVGGIYYLVSGKEWDKTIKNAHRNT